MVKTEGRGIKRHRQRDLGLSDCLSNSLCYFYLGENGPLEVSAFVIVFINQLLFSKI